MIHRALGLLQHNKRRSINRTFNYFVHSFWTLNPPASAGTMLGWRLSPFCHFLLTHLVERIKRNQINFQPRKLKVLHSYLKNLNSNKSPVEHIHCWFLISNCLNEFFFELKTCCSLEDAWLFQAVTNSVRSFFHCWDTFHLMAVTWSTWMNFFTLTVSSKR